MTSLEPLPTNVLTIQRAFDFVGNVQVGQRLYFRKKLYVGRWNLLKRYDRYMVGEDRKYTLDNLNMIFKTYLILKLYNNRIHIQILDTSFVNFYKGVKNLCKTYQDKNFYKFLNTINDYKNSVL